MANKNKSNDNSSKGFLAGVERVGNALPHPAMIFVIMIAILAVISALAAKSNVTVNYYDAKAEENVELAAVSLLNADGIQIHGKLCSGKLHKFCTFRNCASCYVWGRSSRVCRIL